MPKKGENIYKRKDGRWEGRYIRKRSESGKAVYGYVYAKTYREVKDRLRSCRFDPKLSNPQTLSSQLPLQGQKEIILLSSIANEWLSGLRHQVKESTYNKYRNLIDSYIMPAFGNTQICKITNEKVCSFCSALLENGGKKKKGLSAKTVSDTFSVFRRILKYSCEKGYSCMTVSPRIKIQKEEKPFRVLSRNEQKKLCDWLTGNMDKRNLGILLCLFTGLRIGELCALTWEDISFSDNTVYVHRTIQRIQVKDGEETKTRILISTPKSSCSVRTIPLPDEIAKRLYESKSSGYLLTGDMTRYVEPRTMQNHFKRVLKESGIQPANFHALRHSFATRCVELGFDIKSLREILGHASVSITMDRYVHPSMEMKHQNMQKLSELLAVR